MKHRDRNVRVKGVIEQSPSEQVRKISRALIELARAQLEKEAQLEHARRSKQLKRRRSQSDSGDAA